ncbi:hypothetical protein [Antarctobacter heliothermus]|uniref:Response regulatory domain-containing protein n=1 Tax=Antarctobacter heliothermus TaxID=74033 RepID=A0A239EGH2_9RHOB|nr:hypothetical protein [Antarctobacter heliothermus]SNS42994.1 hypothetical protein SAMN04488078_101491 [Antarctobacter heliothermus]
MNPSTSLCATKPPGSEDTNFDDTDDLYRRSEEPAVQDIWGLDLFILHAPKDGISDQFNSLGDWTSSVTVFGRMQDAFRIAARADVENSAFIVNIDVFGPLENAVEELLALRQTNSGLTVVILSADFKRDEASIERAAIADASIRLPCNRERLERGLAAATENAKQRRRSASE